MSGIRGMVWPQLRCKVCGGAPDPGQGFIERVDFSGGESWGAHVRCAETAVRHSRLERTDATVAKPPKPSRDWLAAEGRPFLP